MSSSSSPPRVSSGSALRSRRRQRFPRRPGADIRIRAYSCAQGPGSTVDGGRGNLSGRGKRWIPSATCTRETATLSCGSSRTRTTTTRGPSCRGRCSTGCVTCWAATPSSPTRATRPSICACDREQVVFDAGEHWYSAETGFDVPDDWFSEWWADPLCSYPQRTGDLTSVVITHRLHPHDEAENATRRLKFGHDVQTHMMLSLPAPPGLVRRILFARREWPGFDERDRQVVALLRPHVQEIWLDAERRRAGVPELTNREWEVLALVGSGSATPRSPRACSSRSRRCASTWSTSASGWGCTAPPPPRPSRCPTRRRPFVRGRGDGVGPVAEDGADRTRSGRSSPRCCSSRGFTGALRQVRFARGRHCARRRREIRLPNCRIM